MDDFLGGYVPAKPIPAEARPDLPSSAAAASAHERDEIAAALAAAEKASAAVTSRAAPPAAAPAPPRLQVVAGQTVVALRRIDLITGEQVAPGAKGIVLRPFGSVPGCAGVSFSGVSVDAVPGSDFTLWTGDPTPTGGGGAAVPEAVTKCQHRRLVAECGECPRPDLKFKSAVRVAADGSGTWFDGVVTAQREDGAVVVRVDGFGAAAWDRVVGMKAEDAPPPPP
eukprot:Hpha_TRINITY_DN15711_c1_g16::TRINITY_DN15711_c1_g16_i1::g.39167::m.39167